MPKTPAIRLTTSALRTSTGCVHIYFASFLSNRIVNKANAVNHLVRSNLRRGTVLPEDVPPCYIAKGVPKDEFVGLVLICADTIAF